MEQDTDTSTKVRKYPVIELFGPTVQGEGILAGLPTNFLRFGGCGYNCSWCDSMHAVDPEQVKKNRTMMSVEEILESLRGLPRAPWLTLTGGDPCMHKGLSELIYALYPIRVAVETQGQFWPDWLLLADVVTFSPKGPSSGNVTPAVDFTNALAEFIGKYAGIVAIKIVVKDLGDLDYAFRVYHRTQGYYQRFYFQVCSPLNSDIPEFPIPTENERALQTVFRRDWKRKEILRRYEWLVEQVLRRSDVLNHNTGILPQLHTLLWPLEERGR